MNQRQTLKPLFIFLGLIIGLSFSLPSHAAKIYRVKGKKVYLKLTKKEASSLKKGDRMLILSGPKKKRGILQIRAIKKNKALAVLKKGKAKKSWVARAGKKSSKPKSTMAAGKEEADTSETTSQNQKQNADDIAIKKWAYGVYGGLSFLTMQVKVDTNETVTKTGMNFAAKGYLQYNYSSSLALMASVGYQGFSSKGTSIGTNCNSSSDCTTEISFLASEIWGKYYLSRKSMAYWVGGGSALNFPLQKSSTALDEEGVGLTNVILLGGGVDWTLSSGTMIPIWFEYGLMPATETVEAGYFGINAGYQF